MRVSASQHEVSSACNLCLPAVRRHQAPAPRVPALVLIILSLIVSLTIGCAHSTPRMGGDPPARYAMRQRWSQLSSDNAPLQWPPQAPCRPSFFVIGAPKCGTTSLHGYLSSHPQVQPPARKELCYFSRFKRHMQRNRPNAPSNNWDNYVAAFSGRIMTASFEPQARPAVERLRASMKASTPSRRAHSIWARCTRRRRFD